MRQKKVLTVILSVSILALLLPVLSKSAFADVPLISKYGAAVSTEPLSSVESSKLFEDVSGHWAKPAIDYVLENRIMNGVSTGVFSPETEMSRAMLVTAIWRLEGCPAMGAGKSGVFPDVAEYMWYTEAVEWTVAMEIVKGFEDSTFRPDEPATRQQLAVIIFNYARYAGYDMSASDGLEGFADSGNIYDWAFDSLKWAVGSGLINGRADMLLVPEASATRAEAATILKRFSGLEIS